MFTAYDVISISLFKPRIRWKEKKNLNTQKVILSQLWCKRNFFLKKLRNNPTYFIQFFCYDFVCMPTYVNLNAGAEIIS